MSTAVNTVTTSAAPAAAPAAAATSAAAAGAATHTVTVRKSSDRGHANHGWLNSYHTFSFAGYQDSRFANFGCLRVINEDRVAPGEGFGTHPHSNYEIFSYVVNGGLSHRDSMGNHEVIRRGDIQFTSAGTGIMHSEFNAAKDSDADKTDVHFLQMWVKPDSHSINIKPSYQTKSFTDAQKTNRLCLIVSPDPENDLAVEAAKDEEAKKTAAAKADAKADSKEAAASVAASAALTPASPNKGTVPSDKSSGPAHIHNDIRVYASIVHPGKTVTHDVGADRDVYIHVIQDATAFDKEAGLVGLKINGDDGAVLGGGDGAFVVPKDKTKAVAGALTLTGAGKQDKPTEFILFDVLRGSHLL